MKDVFLVLLYGFVIVMLAVPSIKLYKEFRDRKEQKERLQYSRERLRALTLKFHGDCVAETKKLILQYTAAISKKTYLRSDNAYSFFFEHWKTIENLEKEYWANYALKYSDGDNRLRCEAEDLPNYILIEYKAELSKIAYIFRGVSDYMQQQMEEQEKYWKELLLEEYKEKYN